MKTTFRIPAVALALAASFSAAVSLGMPSSVPAGVAPVDMQETPANTAQTGRRGIADAFPTAEAGFAIRRPIVDRP